MTRFSGEDVRVFLVQRGWSYREAGKQMGFSEATVARWVQVGTSRDLTLMARAFPVPPQRPFRSASEVQDLLGRKGLTGAQAAQILGVTPSTVESWLRIGSPDDLTRIETLVSVSGCVTTPLG